MIWEKKGLIYQVRNQASWMKTHAQCPTALLMGDRIRIFFSIRDNLGESLPTYIDVSKDNPLEILYEHNQPILFKGKLGTFDENGIIPSYIIRHNNEIYLYYAGWSRCENVPYKNFTGLAISKDGGNSFEKFSEGPVLGLNTNNPLSATGPCITILKGEFRCVYSIGIEWLEINNKLEHTYLLSYANSKDGINWKTSSQIVIKPENEYMAHCKPAFFIYKDKYYMWFSKRGSHDFRTPGLTSYRLGFAISNDFINWKRDDDMCGIDVSDSGWDSEMICYPNIIQIDNKAYLFYNGNGFGKSGFGYAEMDLNF